MEDETKKTKQEIEDDVPFIKPEDCPNAVIRYLNKKHKADMMGFKAVIQDELSPLKRWMSMTAENRVWLIVLTIFTIVVGTILVLHVK